MCFWIKGGKERPPALPYMHTHLLTTALDPQAEGWRRPLQNKSNGSRHIIRDGPIPRPRKRHGRHAVIHWNTFRLQKTHTKDKERSSHKVRARKNPQIVP